MIKKLLLGLGISVLGFVGFSSAEGKVQYIGYDGGEISVYNNQLELTFLPGGSVNTMFLGTTKSVLALDSDKIFWWAENGQPYFYSTNWQGFFSEFFSCDVITGYSYNLDSCTGLPITGDYQTIFKNFFNQVTSSDFAYYNYVYNHYSFNGGNRAEGEIAVCFSSESVGHSLCFIYSYCGGANSHCTRVSRGSLINSQDLIDLTFSNIPYSWIGYAPGHVGYGGGGNIDGSSGIATGTIMTGDLMYYTCSNGYIIREIDKLIPNLKYGCFAGWNNLTDILGSGYTRFNILPVYSTGLTYKDLFVGTRQGMQRDDWFTTYFNEYYGWYVGRNGFTFEGRPVALYTYFKGLVDNGISDPDYLYDIANYCKLRLYSDWNAQYNGTVYKSFCEPKGDGSTSVPHNYNTGSVGNVEDNQEVIPPGTNDDGGGDNSVTNSGVVISVDWSGVISGSNNKNYDGKTFISDFYNNLKSNYKHPINNTFGIIPNYILVFMFALILFRFLSH